jgi:hypothetical protein
VHFGIYRGVTLFKGWGGAMGAELGWVSPRDWWCMTVRGRMSDLWERPPESAAAAGKFSGEFSGEAF